MGQGVSVAEFLDVSGLRCPLPVLKTGKVLRGLGVGDVLTVRATDPMTALDIPHFCHEAGHQLLDTQQDAGGLTFSIQRGNLAKTGDGSEDAA